MAELVIAADINEEHLQAVDGAFEAVKHAIRCGELLIQQKQAMGATQGRQGKNDARGTFSSWVKEHCNFSYRQAARYMQAYRDRDAILAAGHDSLRKALQLPGAGGGACVRLPFSLAHARKIAAGEKTQTSRRRPTNAVVGEDVALAVTSCATLRIVRIESKRLGDFTEEDAQREGGYTLPEFRCAWVDMHGSWDTNQEVEVVHFTCEESQL